MLGPHWLARDAGGEQYQAATAAVVDDLDFDYGLRRLPIPEMWQVVTERTGITKDVVSSLTVGCAVALRTPPPARSTLCVFAAVLRLPLAQRSLGVPTPLSLSCVL